MSRILDAYLKVGRAKLHLDSLEQQLRAFHESKPYRVERYDDFQSQRHVVDITMTWPPDDIWLTLGDAMCNLRAGLDFLIWELAGSKAKRETKFPIYLHPPTGDKKRNFESSIDGLAEDAITRVKDLQPYNRGNSAERHPLARLNAVVTLDKHRRIAAHSHEMVISIPETLRSKDFRIERRDEHSGRSIASFPLCLKDEFPLDPVVSFEIFFGGADSSVKVSETMSGVWEIYKFVNDSVLPQFIPLFH